MGERHKGREKGRGERQDGGENARMERREREWRKTEGMGRRE